jgi:hypothetical protein
LTKKISDLPILSSASFEIVSQGWGGANGLWEIGQLKHRMGLKKREVLTFAPRANIPSKSFLHLKCCALIFVHCIILYNTVFIFSSAGYK